VKVNSIQAQTFYIWTAWYFIFSTV